MKRGWGSDVVPSYRLLTEDQIEEIHRASLEILATIGVQFAHPERARLLEQAGCRSRDGGVYQIPNRTSWDFLRALPAPQPHLPQKRTSEVLEITPDVLWWRSQHGS